MIMGRRRKSRIKKHARRRFRERTEINLTQHAHDEMTRQIRKGEARHVYKRTNRVSIFWVKFEGKEYKVAYDKLRKLIVTVLKVKELAEAV